MNTTTAEEVERLRNAELEAEKRHGAAMTQGDLTGARVAAGAWMRRLMRSPNTLQRTPIFIAMVAE
jgi:hypothetical protein